MQKLPLLLIVILQIVSNNCYSQNRLEVEVTNLRSSDGFVLMQLLDDNQKLVKKGKCPVIDKQCVITFENLKAGKYAVKYCHDENSNNKIDKNFLGIPIEGYGFSNNAYGKFRPLPFEKWLFKIKGNTKISLVIKY